MKLIVTLIAFFVVLASCEGHQTRSTEEQSPNSTAPAPSTSDASRHYSNSSDDGDDDKDKDDGNDDNDDDNSSGSGCGFADDTYSATVGYYNPHTGFDNTYTLDVEVEDCQVVQIDFPNGGYLDGDHIDPTDIDDNGDADVSDDKGREFHVHIDK
ncbi:MAG TPA: hypothetical protein VG738_19545 [Chitinophagaceae bacterium]|nr:hypothetical protein [Chitinophagaceae bacterium]